MDTITHEFQGSVRPYYDRPDISVPVQWYRAAPGARRISYLTAFSNPYPSQKDFTPNVGINYDFNPNNAGNIFGRLGQQLCGDANAWANGVSFNNPAPPCHCIGEEVVPWQEVPAGLVDGVNRTFTLSKLPISGVSLLVFVNGVEQRQGTNYSIAGQIIRFSAPSVPRPGANVDAYYWFLPP